MEVEATNGRLDRYSLYSKTRTLADSPPTSVMLPSGQSVEARVLFSRPIYQEEQLDLRYAGLSKKEPLNEHSKFIDAVYLIREAYQVNQQYRLFPGNEWVVNYIATYYYEYGVRFDPYVCSILSYLIDTLSIPLTTKIFPKGEFDSEGDWFTIKDFLTQIGFTTPLSQLLAKFEIGVSVGNLLE